MSRTYNTRPTRIVHGDYRDRYEEGYCLLKRGYLPKLKRNVDTENHWMSTPSWWTRMMMNRPSRSKARIDCHKVHFAIDYEDVDIDHFRDKPYYW